MGEDIGIGPPLRPAEQIIPTGEVRASVRHNEKLIGYTQDAVGALTEDVLMLRTPSWSCLEPTCWGRTRARSSS